MWAESGNRKNYYRGLNNYLYYFGVRHHHCYIVYRQNPIPIIKASTLEPVPYHAGCIGRPGPQITNLHLSPKHYIPCESTFKALDLKPHIKHKSDLKILNGCPPNFPQP